MTIGTRWSLKWLATRLGRVASDGIGTYTFTSEPRDVSVTFTLDGELAIAVETTEPATSFKLKVPTDRLGPAVAAIQTASDLFPPVDPD